MISPRLPPITIRPTAESSSMVKAPFDGTSTRHAVSFSAGTPTTPKPTISSTKRPTKHLSRWRNWPPNSGLLLRRFHNMMCIGSTKTISSIWGRQVVRSTANRSSPTVSRPSTSKVSIPVRCASPPTSSSMPSKVPPTLWRSTAICLARTPSFAKPTTMPLPTRILWTRIW